MQALLTHAIRNLWDAKILAGLKELRKSEISMSNIRILDSHVTNPLNPHQEEFRINKYTFKSTVSAQYLHSKSVNWKLTGLIKFVAITGSVCSIMLKTSIYWYPLMRNTEDTYSRQFSMLNSTKCVAVSLINKYVANVCNARISNRTLTFYILQLYKSTFSVRLGNERISAGYIKFIRSYPSNKNKSVVCRCSQSPRDKNRTVTCNYLP